MRDIQDGWEDGKADPKEKLESRREREFDFGLCKENLVTLIDVKVVG